MIIFGSRAVTYSQGEGQFHCPQCQTQKAYKQKRVRRFFTLYFIPLVPLNMLGEFIECQTCENSYDLKVLEYDPAKVNEKAEAEFHRGIRGIMLLMMLADGRIDDQEVATVKKIYKQLASSDLTDEMMREETERLRSSGQDIEHFASSLCGTLNEHGKEMIIKAAFLIANADGDFHDEEQKALTRISKALEMSGAHFNGVLAEMAQA